MKKYTLKLDADEIRSICIKNDWFTGGTCEAYGKLFSLADDGAPVETLAAVIWANSDGVELEEVTETLKAAELWPISAGYVNDALGDAHFGETERAIIMEALRTHPDAGKAYKII